MLHRVDHFIPGKAGATIFQCVIGSQMMLKFMKSLALHFSQHIEKIAKNIALHRGERILKILVPGGFHYQAMETGVIHGTLDWISILTGPLQPKHNTL